MPDVYDLDRVTANAIENLVSVAPESLDANVCVRRLSRTVRRSRNFLDGIPDRVKHMTCANWTAGFKKAMDFLQGRQTRVRGNEPSC